MRKMRPQAFKNLIQHPIQMLAYCSLRAAFRHVPAVRLNRSAILVAVMPTGADVASYEKAAALLIRLDGHDPFDGNSRFYVHVLDKTTGRTAKNSKSDYDLRISDRMTIFLAHSVESVDPLLRLSADAVVHLKKPSAEHIIAARKLARRSPISRQMAEKIAALDVDAIGAVTAKSFLKDSDLREFEEMRKKPAERGPSLGELPGFAAARAWTDTLLKDARQWRAKTIPWRAVNRGALISGPPGVGKTFFASALARSLGFKLIATSVGAWQSAREGHLGTMLQAMRASFAEARAAGGAVLFIDEIDTIGDRERITGDHIYYETSIITQLLELTDGTADLDGVVIIAATNYPDRVDPALQRSGRFGNHFRFEPPSKKERAETLAYHVDDLVSVEQIRGLTDQLDDITHADLENIALQARSNARNAERALSIDDIAAALPASIDLTEQALLRACAHETGHALIALNTGFVSSVTASVRTSFRQGLSLNYGQVEYEWDAPMVPTEKFLLARIRVALAGMAAEEVVIGDRSVGSGGTKGSDLQDATMIASRMIESYGFGKSLRFMKPARWIDESYIPPPEIHAEIDQILQKEYRTVRDILVKNRQQVEKLAAELFLDKRIVIEKNKIQPPRSARH